MATVISSGRAPLRRTALAATASAVCCGLWPSRVLRVSWSHSQAEPSHIAPSLTIITVSPTSSVKAVERPVTVGSTPMGRLAPSSVRTTPARHKKLGAAPALNSPARPVYRSSVSRSSVAPLSCPAFFRPSATLTSRAALSAANPACSSWAVSLAAIWPSTAAGLPVPIPSHSSIWARPALSQN